MLSATSTLVRARSKTRDLTATSSASSKVTSPLAKLLAPKKSEIKAKIVQYLCLIRVIVKAVFRVEFSS